MSMPHLGGPNLALPTGRTEHFDPIVEFELLEYGSFVSIEPDAVARKTLF
jgi:hypothetical protein